MRTDTLEPPGLLAGARSQAAATTTPEDGLDAFAAEPTSSEPGSEKTRTFQRVWLVAGVLGIVGLSAGVVGAVGYQKWSARPARMASLTIETMPSGLEVSIDGVSRGRTPLTLALAPRAYEATVVNGTERRTIQATLAAGSTTRLEFPVAPAPRMEGVLRVETDPPALPIAVDGSERGASPLILRNLGAGEHEVSVMNGRERVLRRVAVRAGETVSLLIAAPRIAEPAVSAGWISVAAPVALQIREAGKLLGSTESERLMLPAGNHTLDVVNAELGIAERRDVTVTPGKVTAVRVEVPNGTLSLNAQPWAEVWVDGARVGETPIGNLVKPVGRHEVVFRHPELGERRETVTVTTLQPARLGVDLRHKGQ